MTELRAPDVGLYESWAATLREFGTEQMHGSGNWHLPEELRCADTREACLEWVAELARRADTAVPAGEGLVHSDYFWITDAGEVIGFLAVRHCLDAPFLLEEGGHIGYSVRPSRRREGHATRALGLGLRRAAELGIDEALVTCDDDNEPSRRTIERNGGHYDDTRNGKLRYWIATSA